MLYKYHSFKNNNQYIETKIVFQNININKITFDDSFLIMNVTKILFNYQNTIQIVFR